MEYGCMNCNHPVCSFRGKREHYCGNYVYGFPTQEEKADEKTEVGEGVESGVRDTDMSFDVPRNGDGL